MQTTTKKLGMWAIFVALILALPLIAMQFTNEVNWTLFDFVVAGTLLFGTGFIYEFISRTMQNTQSRIILGGVLFVILLIIWADLAVGIFNIPGISGS